MRRPVTSNPRPGVIQALLLMLAGMLPVMGTLTMLPIMPVLFQHFSSHPHVQLLVPMIVTLPSISMALIAPLAGMAADRLSRRRLLMYATGIYALFGLMPLLLNDLYAILLVRLGMGIADAFILTTANALIGDYFTGEQRSRWLAIQGGVGSVIATLIILCSGVLGQFGWTGPVYLYALAIPIFLGLLFFTHETAVRPDEETEQTQTAPFPRRKMAIIALVTLGSSVIYFLEPLQISQVFSLLGMQSSSQTGLATAIAGVGVPLGAWFYGRLARKSVEKQLLWFYGIYGTGLLLIALAGNQAAGVAAAFVAQTGNGLFIPLMLGWVMKAIPSAHRAKGMGIWHACFFLGMFISPILVTLTTGVTGNLQETLRVFAWLTLLAGVLLTASRRMPRALSLSS